MIGFFYEPFGKKMLNEWTKIFKTEFTLDFWSKFWLSWSIGLNIFFALINIYSVKWGYIEIKTFIIGFDILAYMLFVGLCVWGIKAGRCGSGIYSAFIIFFFWIIWGCMVITV